MKKDTSKIGLDKKKSKALATELNQLLSNYQMMYMNTRGFHWNIKGERFFELHLKFEELYNDFQIKIDEIAERILTLGYTPLHTYSEYLKHSQITENQNISDGKLCIEALLKGFTILIAEQRLLMDLSSEAGDEGTNSMMSDYIREQEKLVWMLNAYLG